MSYQWIYKGDFQYYSDFIVETNIQNLELSDDKGKKLISQAVVHPEEGIQNLHHDLKEWIIDGSGASIGCDRLFYCKSI